MAIELSTPPFGLAITDQNGNLTVAWQGFIQSLHDTVAYHGIVLSVQDASASADIEFVTGLTNHFIRYEIDITNASWSAATTLLNLLVSTDRGTTWETGASDYAYGVKSVQYSSGPTVADDDDSSTGAAAISLINKNATNTADNVFNGKIIIHNPAATVKTMITWDLNYNGSSGDLINIKGIGQYLTADIINGIKLVPTSGTITAGRFTLTGFN